MDGPTSTEHGLRWDDRRGVPASAGEHAAGRTVVVDAVEGVSQGGVRPIRLTGVDGAS